jgi:uncharacterized membrane protein
MIRISFIDDASTKKKSKKFLKSPLGDKTDFENWSSNYGSR